MDLIGFGQNKLLPKILKQTLVVKNQFIRNRFNIVNKCFIEYSENVVVFIKFINQKVKFQFKKVSLSTIL